MQLYRRRAAETAGNRRGTALLLSLLVLLVIVAIVFQINIGTSTDAQVARNDVVLTSMDLAIQSAMLQTNKMLKEDAEAAAGGEEEGMPSGDMGDLPAEGGEAAAAPGGEGAATDSRMDEWGQPQSTNINEYELRILVQDENSKYNILTMLHDDEDEAEKAYERVARILDLCREGTEEDIDRGVADEMARVAREHFLDRSESYVPRAELLTDVEDDENLGMPMTLRELVVLEPFEERHFRDYTDLDGNRIHSIEAFLTVWTAPFVGASDDSSGIRVEGGWAVNVNTAPAAVLHGLMDSRDINGRIWDGVIEYRNLEEEDEEQEEETEPMVDEFGQEVFPRRIFEDLSELSEVWGWDDLDPEVKNEVEGMLDVQSHVFSVYVTARHSTAQDGGQVGGFENRAEKEEFERLGKSIVRTVRAVVWRQNVEEEVSVLPLVRWEVIDYSPLEILDYPEDEYY